MSVLLRKKYESIKKEKLSDSGKALLKSMAAATNNFKDAKASAKIKTKFLAFFDKLKTSKPEAIKGLTAPKEPSNAKQFKEARERRSGQSGVPQRESDIEKDAGRPAISVKGKRVTDGKHYPYIKGNVYYEYRDNRFDKRPKKYPKLEDGGMMADGGSLQNKISHINETYQGVTASKTYSSNRIQVVSEDFNILNKIKSKEFNNDALIERYGNMSSLYVLYSNEIFADGGTMAKGGSVKEEIEIKGHTIKHIKNSYDDYWYFVYQSTPFEFETKEEAVKSLNGLIKTNPYADGGEMAMGGEPHRIDEIFADGGSIAQGNNEMLESQLKAVEHHAKELSSIVNKNTEVEAWVVGKIERAATDLSDITHYLDGLVGKMAIGGMLEHDLHRGDEVKEIYKDYGILEDADMNIFVYDPNVGERIDVSSVNEAKRMIDSMDSDLRKRAGLMADGGHTQGYDDREDERLSMEYGKISGKDFVGSHKQREHSRRDDARFEERMAKGGEMMEKGGIIKEGDIVNYAPNGKWFRGNNANFKTGEVIKVQEINGTKLYTIEFKNKFGTIIGTAQTNNKKEIRLDTDKFAKGGKLIGKQKNIDVNKNGKLDAEDFKLLRQKAKSRLKK